MAFKSNTRPRARTDFIAIHCSATKPSLDASASDIDRWHRAKGWICIGYHYVIRRDGTVEEGRPQELIGAHVEGFNAVSVGICMVGGVTEADINVPENNFTDKQFASLQQLVTRLKTSYPSAVVQGHRDFPKVAKACPSFDAKAWAKEHQL